MFSADDLIFNSIWPAALIVLSVIIAVLQRTTKFKLVFGIIGAVVFAGSIVVLMAIGASLADVLIYITCTCLSYVIAGLFKKKEDKT